MLTEEQKEQFEDMVDLDCSYDEASGHIRFEDDISANNRLGVYYLNHGTDDGMPELRDIVDEKKLLQEPYNVIDSVINGCDGNTGISEEDFKDSSFDIGDIFDDLFFSQDTIDSLKNYLKEKVEVYTTRGYSQGDVENVILFGDDADDSNIHDYIDHLFWDWPIYCRLTIDEEEYYYSGEDDYTYDKDDYIKFFLKEADKQLNEKGVDKEAFKEYLEEIFPEYPRY